MTRIAFATCMMVVVIVSSVAPSGRLSAQDEQGKATPEQKKADTWKPMQYFVGTWTGSGDGQSGTSQMERTYSFTLGHQFLSAKNKAVYAPQEKNPKGETHEDMGMFSFDRNRRKFVLRQFHMEGFVNQYVLEEMSEDGAKMVFVTEQIENIPPGWRARETYRRLDENRFEETFELAGPGAEFEVYSKTTFKRK